MDYFSMMSNGVHFDSDVTDDEWARLAISYGFITDTLGETIITAIINGILQIGRSGIRFASKMLRIG